MVVEDIINFFPMTETIGSGGQPTPGQAADIAAAGYTTVTNLAMHNFDNVLLDEGGIVASLGMDYVHIPVPFKAPSTAHLGRLMTARWARLPYDFLEQVNLRIINEVERISCVTCDISGKPPATIEWE